MSTKPAKKKVSLPDNPLLKKNDAAKILNISHQTITNQEDKGNFPEPHRKPNGFRFYTIEDIIRLQMLYHHKVNLAPIIAKLYDLGYTDVERCRQMIDQALRGLASTDNAFEVPARSSSVVVQETKLPEEVILDSIFSNSPGSI